MFSNVFDGKKVLVTGHTGFKGTWMTIWLQQMGAEVVGISDKVPTDPAHFIAAGLEDSMKTHWLDIRDEEAIPLPSRKRHRTSCSTWQPRPW